MVVGSGVDAIARTLSRSLSTGTGAVARARAKMSSCSCTFGWRHGTRRSRTAPSTPLELFFDLTFVVAIAQAASGLHHDLVRGHAGDCWAITVQGSSNIIIADNVVNDITVYGSDQAVMYHSGEPSINDRGRELGMTNRIDLVPA